MYFYEIKAATLAEQEVQNSERFGGLKKLYKDYRTFIRFLWTGHYVAYQLGNGFWLKITLSITFELKVLLKTIYEGSLPTAVQSTGAW